MDIDKSSDAMTGSSGSNEMQSFGRELRSRVRLADISLLLFVPVILISASWLPTTIFEQLVLSYSEPTILSLLTTHFLHSSPSHLLGNLSAYAIIVPVSYFLCLLAGRRTEFIVSFVAYLVAIPIVLSGLNIALFPNGVLLGFSGILMAFVGFLPLAIVWYAQTVAQLKIDIDHSPGFFFLGLAIVAIWTVQSIQLQMIVMGLTLLIILVYVRNSKSGLRLNTIQWPSNTGYPELGGIGVVVFLLGAVMGFQSAPVVDGTVINFYGHFLGYAIGFIAAYLTFRTASWNPMTHVGH